ncbi:MAG: Polynucleotide adenylyltransferase region [Hyphomicrobiales bacterium]|nr:Polynucleotide adenylyltransferase region [Hyphomicrobiales bacterium]
MSEAGRISSPSFLDDPRLRKLFAALDGEGEELRVVGGAIRNHLMQLPVTEVDLTTTASPHATMARARAAGLKCVPTGLDHGTVTVIVDHQPFEVTTLREDVETDGRRAKVAFGRDFRDDAMRRDFTCNALSARADGTLFDYAGGLQDIAARRVRFIGDPATRIVEDYLRILRFFRFHAAFGEGAADATALAAIARNRAGLNGLSRERVRAELLKLLEARGAASAILLMNGLGLVTQLLGGVITPLRLARIGDIEHARGSKADSLLRLAALAVLTREDADRLRETLRLSNAEHARLVGAADAAPWLHRRDAPPDENGLRLALYRRGRTAVCDAIDIAHASAPVPPDDAAWTARRAQAAQLSVPRFPVSGATLMARGAPAGKAMGETLRRIEAAWIATGFPESADAIASLVDAALKPSS